MDTFHLFALLVVIGVIGACAFWCIREYRGLNRLRTEVNAYHREMLRMRELLNTTASPEAACEQWLREFHPEVLPEEAP